MWVRDVTSRPRATATCVVGVAALLAAGFVAGDVELARSGHGDLRQLVPSAIPLVAGIVVAGVVGVSLILRRPRHPVGYLFAGLSLLMLAGGATEAYGALGMVVRPRHQWPAAHAIATWSDSSFVGWLVSLGLICHLTPDGTTLSPRWRRAAIALPLVAVVWVVVGWLSSQRMNAPFEHYRSAWAVPALARPMELLEHAGAAITLSLVLVGMASLVVRFRRSTGDDRRRLLWFVATAAVPLPILVLGATAASATHHELLLNVAAGGFVCALPVAAWLSITRYHLYDVERVLNRALSYAIVTLLLATTYVVVVLAIGRLVAGGAKAPLSVALATLAAAVVARPAYSAVQEAVDRRFARRRYEALRLVRSYLAAPDPQRSIEDVLREALRDDQLSVAYWLPDDDMWVTADGLPAAPPGDGVPVVRTGRDVARVSSTTERADVSTLRAVLDEAASELDNVRLRAAVQQQLEEVRASRARIAAAQLEERRRIERDLHDGAQQRLLALAAQLQAARLNGDDDRMRAALDEGTAQAREAVLELRRLANGLHPSVLSDGGLSAAFDDLAARLPVRIDAASIRRYPTVVEATAWFVVCEAVANAVKHSGAEQVELSLSDADDGLHLRIRDHGKGGANTNGHGLRGIADRVEAVGGRLAVTSTSLGTVIEAVLPCES